MLQRKQIHNAVRMICQMQDRVIVKNDSIGPGNPKQPIAHIVMTDISIALHLYFA